MTLDMIQGLMVVFTLSTACVILCPVMYWVLSFRVREV